jgi:hypothetical protein
MKMYSQEVLEEKLFMFKVLAKLDLENPSTIALLREVSDWAIPRLEKLLGEKNHFRRAKIWKHLEKNLI